MFDTLRETRENCSRGSIWQGWFDDYFSLKFKRNKNYDNLYYKNVNQPHTPRRYKVLRIAVPQAEYEEWTPHFLKWPTPACCPSYFNLRLLDLIASVASIDRNKNQIHNRTRTQRGFSSNVMNFRPYTNPWSCAYSFAWRKNSKFKLMMQGHKNRSRLEEVRYREVAGLSTASHLLLCYNCLKLSLLGSWDSPRYLIHV